MTLERMDLSQINAEAVDVPRYGDIESGRVRDHILEPLFKFYNKRVMKYQVGGSLITHFLTKDLTIITESDYVGDKRRYKRICVVDKNGKELTNVLDLFSIDTAIETTEYRDSTNSDKSGIHWLGPLNLGEFLSLFHEIEHLEREREMPEDVYKEYIRAYLLLSRDFDIYKDIIKPETLEMIRLIEWQCWEGALIKLKSSGLQTLLFRGINQSVLRRYALSCYRTYL